MSGETRRILSLNPPGCGLKYRSSGCLVMQQVGVDLRQIAQLERVVTAHRVAALEALGAHQVRDAVRQHVEVDRAVVVIQEEGVVERRRLARQTSGIRHRPARRPGSGRPGCPVPAATRPCGRGRRSGAVPRPARARVPSRRTSRRAAGRRRRRASRRRSCGPVLRIPAWAAGCTCASGSRRSSGCGRPRRDSAATCGSDRATSPRRTFPARTGCGRNPGSAARWCRRCIRASWRSVLRRSPATG